ncbi:hypothetical protein BT96DRAFT_940188 [Gymnopus androsaceus JB14]|uniref:Uncharacterized protein n=1 Tax=Gymnopus androsaceus JB14 TaxID=1447944 RepID=A0A6A4HI09_9AGAR|nr:hypothetical protein BT96DRAFT_940188 [Gymnopus androsaceus JB14]
MSAISTIQGEPPSDLRKGETGCQVDKHPPIITTPTYDPNCQFDSEAELATCECGCRDYQAYLDQPLLSPCESVIKGFSPGPARDRHILRILRAGHRPDFNNYVRVHRPDLLRRHEFAMEIVREYRESMQIVERSRANAIVYEELLREDPEEQIQEEEILLVSDYACTCQKCPDGLSNVSIPPCSCSHTLTMSAIHSTDVAQALAHQLTAKRVPGSDPSHGGNLHITGSEERELILASMDWDDENEVAKEAFVRWCIDFRDAQRSLWDSERAPIEESIMQEIIKQYELRHHKEITPEVRGNLRTVARARANERLRALKRKEIEGWKGRKEEQELKEEPKTEVVSSDNLL